MEIGLLVNAIEFDFSSNFIETLPTSLSLCINLELLHLGNNKLSAIPPEIFSSLTKLRELQLYKNKLTIVPPEIGNLHGIQRLSIASNNIRTLPDEIGECSALQELYLSNNAKLVAVPGTCGHLRFVCDVSMGFVF